MCQRISNKDIKRIIREESKYIFRTLTETEEDFNRCYMCGKILNLDNFNLLKLPTEERVICLCKKCGKTFRKQAKVNKELTTMDDKELLQKITDNTVTLPEIYKEQLIQLSFAHKIWLDKQRSINVIKSGDRNTSK